ncbi:hypothetical protein FB451DRAFT_1207193 [Mycena latifolia]|nr:hypothetical protein FB451DRAFT_1207193 [Mycena latifolia]
MPRTTKAQAQSDVIYVAEGLMALFEYQDEFEADLLTDDVSEILDLSAMNWIAIAESMTGDGSRGSYDHIPKSADFFSVCLQAPAELVLTARIFSVGRDMFNFLVKVLSHNQIFQSRGRGPQRHAKYQLGCFLIRYGAVGSDSIGTAQKLSIGFGTVFLYCCRVRRALRELRPQYVGWPIPERKVIIKRDIENISGFSRCLGAGDGSLIRFEEIPKDDGHLFMTRKKSFGVISRYLPRLAGSPQSVEGARLSVGGRDGTGDSRGSKGGFHRYR